ncbi:NADPH:quinone reductase [Lysobacter arenosi]|uniref:NADPH:quinone reductase n=1 Tax=Lysobacter arenosi TaxID=2795387 RepID=A0ABX7RC47_9GAMM|nr:NADPH:quinone reductase [Lysobacter arenosi]QSX74972.1 NADPH:quinone reductase [Lysobacter arenosi]
MRAAAYSRTGPARDVLAIIDKDRPEPGPGEVRVRVAWSGVNPSDVKARAGTRSSTLPYPSVVPHSDGAGVVDALGEGVPAQRLGERVWIWNGAWGRADGTAAEWIVLPSAQAVALPDAVALDVGANFGIPALTACHAVMVDGGVAGKRVLVAGGAGAVGHYAVQMARLSGASQVIATVSSAEKAERARAAGADAVIDYRSEDVVARVGEETGGHGVDCIIEVDFAANAEQDFAMLAPEGRIVVYGSGASEIKVPFVPAILKNVRLSFFIVYNLSGADRAAAIERLHEWAATGALQHAIALRLPLEEIAQAHEAVESGRVMGNVLLSIGDATP